MLDRHSLHCSLVHSYQSEEEYREELKCFMLGQREVIINVGILTTGWDHPPVSEIFLAKPTKALNKYTQMIGRGTRNLTGVTDGLETAAERKAAIAASDKPFFIVHDLTDSSRCHKLCTALDVLCDQKKDIRIKVRDSLKDEATLEEIDAAVAAEMEAEREAARLQRDTERKRREGLVLGVTFDSYDHDPFGRPDRDTPRRREFRAPFGKWKGQPLSQIPVDYLRWALKEARLTPMWKQAFKDAIDRKANEERWNTAK
jgi:superfamily II DNA or RNA helicase